jgi:hypothetical protein
MELLVGWGFAESNPLTTCDDVPDQHVTSNMFCAQCGSHHHV